MYETSDDSTIDGDNNLPDKPDQPEEDQQQHFNVPEVNDIYEDNSNSENKGMGEEGVGEKNDLVQENEETVHEIEDEDGTGEEDNGSVHKSVRGDDLSIDSVKKVDNDKEEKPRAKYNKLYHKQPLEPEEAAPPRAEIG